MASAIFQAERWENIYKGGHYDACQEKVEKRRLVGRRSMAEREVRGMPMNRISGVHFTPPDPKGERRNLPLM